MVFIVRLERMTLMHFIGITGGVGAGKSKILNYLKNEHGAYVIETDELAKKLMEPGTDLYRKIYESFYMDHVYDDNCILVREKMAELIFKNPSKRLLLNSLVHPEVKAEIVRIKNQLEDKEIHQEKKSDAINDNDGEFHIMVVEAALLIEEHYDEICDELWYIYAGCNTRKNRLKSTRGYSDAKISDMMKEQKSDLEFRKKCKRYIDNNGDIEVAYRDIDIAVCEL
jgi:dephospho-CoA kinase